MELKELVSVQVNTLHQFVPNLELKVFRGPEGISVKEICEKIGTDLRLKQSSLPCFSLFIGNKIIQKRHKSNDYLPCVTKDLYFRKWCFEDKTEKLLLKDGVACHLLYKEAELKLHNGLLKCTKEQKQLLDEYSDENFRCEEKFVTLCHSIDNYFSVQLQNCAVIKNEVECSCRVSISQFPLKIFTEKEVLCLPWFCIKQWTVKSQIKRMNFLYVTQDFEDMYVTVQTEQVEYLFDLINEFFKVVQTQGKDSPKFFSEMVKKTADGGITYLNPLFDLDKVKHNFRIPS